MPIKLFPKNIQRIFILILLFKKLEMIIGCVNYIRPYQLNFNLIEESEITSWYRAENALYLNNTKKIVFYRPIEPHQFETSNYQWTWPLNYPKKNFIIRAQVTFKHAENCSFNYFCLAGLLNHPSHKVMQIKSFFYNNLLTQPSFPTNIGNYINSQTNLSFKS